MGTNCLYIYFWDDDVGRRQWLDLESIFCCCPSLTWVCRGTDSDNSFCSLSLSLFRILSLFQLPKLRERKVNDTRKRREEREKCSRKRRTWMKRRYVFSTSGSWCRYDAWKIVLSSWKEWITHPFLWLAAESNAPFFSLFLRILTDAHRDWKRILSLLRLSAGWTAWRTSSPD